jgi:hypothetical protein
MQLVLMRPILEPSLMGLKGGEMMNRIIIGLIVVVIFLTVYFWPVSHADNFDPRSDEYSHGECP